jgi:hypothetical protein
VEVVFKVGGKFKVKVGENVKWWSKWVGDLKWWVKWRLNFKWE